MGVTIKIKSQDDNVYYIMCHLCLYAIPALLGCVL